MYLLTEQRSHRVSVHPADGHTDKLLRSTILGMLDTFAWNDPSVAAEAKRRFDLHFTDPTALPAEYKVM